MKIRSGPGGNPLFSSRRFVEYQVFGQVQSTGAVVVTAVPPLSSTRAASVPLAPLALFQFAWGNGGAPATSVGASTGVPLSPEPSLMPSVMLVMLPKAAAATKTKGTTVRRIFLIIPLDLKLKLRLFVTGNL